MATFSAREERTFFFIPDQNFRLQFSLKAAWLRLTRYDHVPFIAGMDILDTTPLEEITNAENTSVKVRQSENHDGHPLNVADRLSSSPLFATGKTETSKAWAYARKGSSRGRKATCHS